jgi:hypothetical protein
MLLLVNYRPEYQHGWGSKTYYRQLQINPLPPESADELLDALLGNDAALAVLKRLLIDRTEGNPFFLEESVHILVETGVLVGDRGGYRLAKATQTLQIPAPVQVILAARIDRLELEDKRLLQAASEKGDNVPHKAKDVAKVLDMAVSVLPPSTKLVNYRRLPRHKAALAPNRRSPTAEDHDRSQEVAGRLVWALMRLHDLHIDMTVRQAMCLLTIANQPGITLQELYEKLKFHHSLAPAGRAARTLGTSTGNRASVLFASRRDIQTDDSACCISPRRARRSCRTSQGT